MIKLYINEDWWGYWNYAIRGKDLIHKHGGPYSTEHDAFIMARLILNRGGITKFETIITKENKTK